MTDQTKARAATPSELVRDMFDVIRTADSVQVHRVNALGCYDTYNFGPDCIAAWNNRGIPDALEEIDRLTAENERLRDSLQKTVVAANMREEYHRLPNDKSRIGSPKSPKGRSREIWLRAFRRAEKSARAALGEKT